MTGSPSNSENQSISVYFFMTWIKWYKVIFMNINYDW
jgi:hypothetical protein